MMSSPPSMRKLTVVIIGSLLLFPQTGRPNQQQVTTAMNFRARFLILIVAGGIRGSLGDGERILSPLRGGGSKATQGIPKPIIVKDADVPFEELDQLRLEDVDFSLPVPDDVAAQPGHHDGNRTLQGTTISTWYCRTNSGQNDVGSVRIWWGHTSGAGAWACNAWVPKCSGDACYALAVTKSLWNCLAIVK